MIDCRELEFSPSLAAERIRKAGALLGRRGVEKVLGLALYWMGARRPAIAEALGIPENSLRTTVRVVHRDGLSGLQDRRRGDSPARSPGEPPVVPSTPPVVLGRSEGIVTVSCGNADRTVSIPAGRDIQARVVVLSLLQSGLVSVSAAADALDLSTVHVRSLLDRLEGHGVAGLLDRRRGAVGERVLTPEVKASVVLQCAANAMAGLPTSSAALAGDLQARLGLELSPRTLRHCMQALGLRRIASELPDLVDRIEKGSAP
jgi:transposase